MSGASVYINVAGLLIIVICGLMGFAKGFMSQMISVAAAVAAALVTYYFQAPAGQAVYTWLSGRMPTGQLDPALVKFGCAVALFGITYISVAAFLEAIKKRLVQALALRTSDRLLGLCVGLMKGAVIVIACVTVLDWGSVYAARIMTPESFERYGQTLDNTEVIAGSRYALGLARIYSPGLSNVLARIEQSLPRDSEQP